MKKNILVPVLFLFSACKGPGDSPVDANLEIVRKTFEAFNNHDWSLMTSYYTDTAYFLDPSLGKDYVTQTREQSIKKYTNLQNFAPDIYDSIVDMYASGNKVTVEFISTGTTGGQKWRFPLCSILTIKDGKVVRDATYYDQ
ncbi:MAG TPA: nuclear transport factor 2 family protein [Flavipsychrobacter sp.]|nr:nuclear transport factor 2 family protein [Flavipsychrobacter sp.]